MFSELLFDNKYIFVWTSLFYTPIWFDGKPRHPGYYKDIVLFFDGKLSACCVTFTVLFFIEIMGENLIFSILKRGPPLKKNYAKGYPLWFRNSEFQK